MPKNDDDVLSHAFMSLASLNPRSQVNSDSPAGISGLSDGDIILQINGIPSTEITHQQGINMIKSAGLELNLVAERWVGWSPKGGLVKLGWLPKGGMAGGLITERLVGRFDR